MWNVKGRENYFIKMLEMSDITIVEMVFLGIKIGIFDKRASKKKILTCSF